MSCALCTELRRRVGRAPYMLPEPDVDEDPLYQAMRNGWVNQWDVHAFGEWLARDMWP
eukprot:CAMPEP_0119364506 /NCGR_PEP_ID=MMETSP1334-20130426/11420_1 /TAXON_ID=127549 /ORGANISM="Calcidiscus leptoporus, Strain RCC1130" /LENGTH=57 /DNA_ID=CAMNT_0007380223 /DNA_START=16 /DNA_END=186 /DNA_ORIENTATION=-